jgi:hypothetical protein
MPDQYAEPHLCERRGRLVSDPIKHPSIDADDW